MIYFKNDEWHICKEKVKYIQDGKNYESFIGIEGNEWWASFSNIHKDVDIIEFVEIVPTENQINRLREVNNLNVCDGFGSVLSGYVIDGKFPKEVNHILKDLENKKIRELNEDYLVDIDFRLSIQEIGL